MKNKVLALMEHRALEVAFRWFLGVSFMAASIHKIVDPAAFAKVVYGYGLFPAETINLIAILIPFVELVAGAALVTGLYVRGAALLLNVLVVFFLLAISYNLFRGYEFDCGCFSVKGGGSSSPRQLLVRDLFYLASGIHVFLYRGRRLWSRG